MAVALVLLPCTVFTWNSYRSSLNTFKDNIEDISQTTHNSYNNAIEGLKTKGLNYGEFLVNNGSINEAVAYAQMTDDNSSLLGILENYYKSLDLNNLEFTNKDGIVLARGHKPDKFNDSKLNFPFTQKMLKERKKDWDYEIGKSGVTLKFSVPIVVDDEYAGFIGYGYYINDDFLASIKKVLNAELIFILKKDEQIISSTKKELSKENLNTNLLKMGLEGQKEIELERKIGENSYSLLYLPVLNAENQVFGAVCILKDITGTVQKNRTFIAITWGSTVGVAGLAILIAFLLTRSITRPLIHTVNIIRDIAEGEGDLTQRLPVDSNDEVGELARQFNQFVGKLQEMIRSIGSSVTTLSSSSDGLTNISSQLATAATETANKSESVSVAAEEMSTNINSVSAAMEQASANINMVASATEEMSATVNEIATNAEKARTISAEAVKKSQTTTDKMNQLGQSANRIGKVTETITEISEQTNLLALNATIEAARAGDAGKGFAVVANEIKELAKQTAGATVDIKSQIEEMQTSTGKTVADMEAISEVIAEINNVINGIATAVEEQSASTSEISSNISQSSLGIAEVNENVAQSSLVVANITKEIAEINQATVEVDGGSTQVQASAGELSTLAEELDTLLSEFKV